MEYTRLNITHYIFIYLLSIVQFIPALGAIDKLAPQFLYLSIVNLLSLTFQLKNPSSSHISLYTYKNNVISVFLCFLLVCSLSVFWAFNSVEGLITFFKVLIIFFTILNLTFHFKQIKITFKEFAYLIVFLLATDILNMLTSFINIYEFNSPSPQLNQIKGFASNRNVTSFSVLFKLPFLYYLIFNSKSVLKTLVICLIYLVSLFFLVNTYSRGAIISFVLLTIAFTSFQLFWNKKSIPKILIILFIGLMGFLLNIFIYQNGNNFSDRLQTLTVENIEKDKSTDERLTWYLSALNGIKEKPFTGFGIGNWKIVGNKYVSQYIEQYKIPKHVHNDFLQVFTEVGIFGFIFFVLIFIFSVRYILKIYKSNRNDSIIVSSVLMFALVSYLFDSTLNFPFERPISLVNLSLIIAYVNSKFLKVSKVNSIRFKLISSTHLLLAFASIFSSYKLYKGSVDEIEFIDRIGH